MYTDGRGKHPNSNQFKIKFTETDSNLVCEHITSFPKEESHYSRSKSTREFLSLDLNMHRIFKMFKDKYPQSQVTYRYYSDTFHKNFPKLKYGNPKVDSCGVTNYRRERLVQQPRKRKRTRRDK